MRFRRGARLDPGQVRDVRGSRVGGAGGLDPIMQGQLGDTWATACPNTQTMVTKLVVGNGNCNQCHAAAGGTTLPVYLTPP